MRTSSSVICTLLIALAVACSQPPGGPSGGGSSLSLQKGPQALDLTGYDISSNPEFPPCSNPGSPQPGKRVATTVSLDQSGSDWIARSMAPDSTGTLELRFHGTGEIAMGGQALVGTITGSARDVTFRDVRIDIAGTAQVTGRVTGISLTMGKLAGTLAFADSAGAGGTCSAVEFLMQPSIMVPLPLAR